MFLVRTQSLKEYILCMIFYNLFKNYPKKRKKNIHITQNSVQNTLLKENLL